MVFMPPWSTSFRCLSERQYRVHNLGSRSVLARWRAIMPGFFIDLLNAAVIPILLQRPDDKPVNPLWLTAGRRIVMPRPS